MNFLLEESASLSEKSSIHIPVAPRMRFPSQLELGPSELEQGPWISVHCTACLLKVSVPNTGNPGTPGRDCCIDCVLAKLQTTALPEQSQRLVP